VRAYDGKRVELVIGRPAISFETSPSTDEYARARITARVYSHSRSLSDPYDPGTSAAATFHALTRIGLSGGDPAPVSDARLTVDWQDTGPGVITVDSVPLALQYEVKDILVHLLQGAGGKASAYRLKASGSWKRFSRISPTSYLPAPVLVGMNIGAGIAGEGRAAVAFPGSHLPFRFVSGLIREKMRQRMGASPDRQFTCCSIRPVVCVLRDPIHTF
jgi:hypothetical protein